MKRAVTAFIFCLVFGVAARADDTALTNLSGRAILQRVLANRPLKDFSLKARLFVTPEDIVPFTIEIKNTPTETLSIYRSKSFDLLAVQPVDGPTRLYLRGTGELTGAARMQKLLGSHVTYYDLTLPFLHWPNPKAAGEGRARGRDCLLVEITATNEPYAKVKLWIDKQYFGMVRAEAYNNDEMVIRRFSVTSLKHIDDVWIPRAVEFADVPPGQALPNDERSRLQIDEGNYDAHLPVEKFSPALFGAQ